MHAPIVIASPHARNDSLEARVRERIGNPVVRMRSREELAAESLAGIAPEYVFFPHWSWIIPETIHERFECVIFHMTDVPYGRGGSPLQNLLVRGHTETKLTALRCTRDVDAGPVYMKRPLSLAGTAEEILVRASALMEEMIVSIVAERPRPVPQEGDVVEFRRRTPKDGDLTGLASLSAAHTYIRMLDAEGYPHAFIDTTHLHLEFTDAHEHEGFVEARVRFHKRKSE